MVLKVPRYVKEFYLSFVRAQSWLEKLQENQHHLHLLLHLNENNHKLILAIRHGLNSSDVHSTCAGHWHSHMVSATTLELRQRFSIAEKNFFRKALIKFIQEKKVIQFLNIFLYQFPWIKEGTKIIGGLMRQILVYTIKQRVYISELANTLRVLQLLLLKQFTTTSCTITTLLLKQRNTPLHHTERMIAYHTPVLTSLV